jgi:ribosome-binding protein aMBF1 (putative translation factor)
MICEICGGAALDRTPADYDGTKIDCLDCGRNFAIAGTIHDRFRQLEPEERVGAFQKAMRRASPGTRPLISSMEF